MSKPTYNDYSTFFVPEIAGSGIEGANCGSDTNTDKFGVDRFIGLWVYLEIGTVTGTSPTLDVKLRAIIPTGPDNDPYATSQAIQIMAMTQITAAGKYAAALVSQGNSNFPDATAVLAAASSKTVPLSPYCDLFFDVGGTSPIFPIVKARIILVR